MREYSGQYNQMRRDIVTYVFIRCGESNWSNTIKE